MKTMQLFALACFGVFMLYWGFAPDNGAVDCGGRPMSPGQECFTTSIRGGHASSYTHSYAEQREQNRREKLFVGVFGGVLLLVGAGLFIDGARRGSERKSNQEYIRRPNAGVKSSRSGRFGDERIEAEFKNVFFNRTHADRERIIAYWMRAKTVSRNDAMKLAVEDWRNNQSRY